MYLTYFPSNDPTYLNLERYYVGRSCACWYLPMRYVWKIAMEIVTTKHDYVGVTAAPKKNFWKPSFGSFLLKDVSPQLFKSISR